MDTTFGAQTVLFVSLAGTGIFENNDFEQEIMEEVTVPVSGCRHRPLTAQEASELFGDMARQVWQTTAPPVAAAMGVSSTGRLLVDGIEYHVIGGAQTFVDIAGKPFKVTVVSEVHPN